MTRTTIEQNPPQGGFSSFTLPIHLANSDAGTWYDCTVGAGNEVSQNIAYRSFNRPLGLETLTNGTSNGFIR